MRLGGFVIHGNSVETLGRCLDGLQKVCDEVVTIDSLSTDGSAELIRSRGIRTILLPWQGFGAARAAAVEALTGCDYLFYLDSDEYLLEPAIEKIHAWRESNPSAPVYRVKRRNWAELSGRRFLYRTDTRARLVRHDAAAWTPQMIVHEALPRGQHPLTRVVVEHRFATSLAERLAKDDRYALLWAIRAFNEGRRPKPYWLERCAHLVRDLAVKGALFRGGLDAIRLSWVVSRYHAQKQHYLRSVRAGEYGRLVADFKAGEFARLFKNTHLLRGHSAMANTGAK
jgi:glycosyltransferase involved in cell wall biosynthesis